MLPNLSNDDEERMTMFIKFSFIENGSYLLATINETVITAEGAKAILKSVGDECKKLNCRRVLLNELTVEKREVVNHELREIGNGISGLKIGFLCKPALMDKSARLLSAITYAGKYKVRHFSVEDEAINWLTTPSSH